jgi:hypothetical protein
MGLFEEWQPQFAEAGIATFPVADKRPLVGHYLKMGIRASTSLVPKYGNAEQIGFACGAGRCKITVLDVDTPDEKVLADALDRHGQTPIVVRSGSGNYQAWYRHNGERRKVRPDRSLPIDILGGGFVVAPPSFAQKQRYRFVQGSLADVDSLPVLWGVKSHPNTNKHPSPPDPSSSPDRQGSLADVDQRDRTSDGQRNNTLWRECMKMARGCHRIEELMEKAMEHNRAAYYEPLPADEVLKIVASAWGYEVEDKNWFGYGPRVILAAAEVDELAAAEPNAYALLGILRRYHAGSDDFKLAKAMAVKLGWTLRAFKAARDVLVEHGLIECIHPGGRRPNDPPIYRFKGGTT